MEDFDRRVERAGRGEVRPRPAACGRAVLVPDGVFGAAAVRARFERFNRRADDRAADVGGQRVRSTWAPARVSFAGGGGPAAAAFAAEHRLERQYGERPRTHEARRASSLTTSPDTPASEPFKLLRVLNLPGLPVTAFAPRPGGAEPLRRAADAARGPRTSSRGCAATTACAGDRPAPGAAAVVFAIFASGNRLTGVSGSRRSQRSRRTRGPAAPSSSPGGFDGAALPGGRRAPAFCSTDQYGRSVSLAVLRGEPVLLAFLYARCGAPCVADRPADPWRPGRTRLAPRSRRDRQRRPRR